MPYKIKADLPMKYSLGVHQLTPNYPTVQDFLFDVITYYVKLAEQKGKPLDPADLKFSSKTLKYIFGENMKSEEFLDRIKNILKDLLESNFMERKGEFLHIDEDQVTKYYELI